MLIAVDAGGTSTRAAVLAPSGDCLGYGFAGAGNPVSWGQEAAARSIGAAVREAREQALARGCTDDADGIAVLAMAGASTTLAPEMMRTALAGTGHRGRVEVASDLLATFCSGTASSRGYVLVAGTGAAAVRIESGASAAVADGLGWLLGDCGSGFWIGHQVIRAAMAALGGYGPPTELVTSVGAELGLPLDAPPRRGGRSPALDTAVERLYALRPVEMSRFAALAFTAAEADAADAVAEAILVEARRQLLTTLRSVLDARIDGPIVMGGGIAARLPGLAAAVAATAIDAGLPRPSVTVVRDGIVGASVLALRAAGHVVDDVVFGRVTAGIAVMR